jgi:DNA-binding winged helix-turn-helix (wHTH) protein/tetratricopeptide (TPR) repeat protein
MSGTFTAREISFGPFRLDAGNARLMCDGRPVAITPKAFDVLHHLASRPQRLVTKDELLTAVWPDVIVSDASVKVCVREIRKALDDDPKTPSYIETVHRRGYRFVANVNQDGVAPDVALTVQPAAEPVQPTPLPSVPAPKSPVGTVVPAPPRHGLVGRDAELRRLAESFRLAQWGRRQCVFVSGGPGGGKTVLTEAFVETLADGAASATQPLVLAGHCFEQFGTSEPYMPVWEAVARLSRERPSPVLASLLARHAAAHSVVGAASTETEHPSPLPSPIAPPTPPALRGTAERLLREIADGIEAMASEAPVVLLLEDVHWADYSTIDLISALARRRSPARLMVVATYRPAEILAPDHPLRGVVQGLVTAGLARDVALDFLDEQAVAQFLASRFPGTALPPALVHRLHQRTDGHPLFLVHLVDDLVARGILSEHDGAWRLAGMDASGDASPTRDDSGPPPWLAALETHIPQTVRAMIEVHLERLERPVRQVLEAAAVAGVEFSAAAVAAALAADVVHAEQVCDDLARRHRFLQPRGIAEWPDGTAATKYRFVHELYHHVVYEQVPVARRVRMHQLVGLTLEDAWASRAAEEAANLAMHFETGRDWPRAVKYLRLAAHAAARQYAHREAAHYLARALAAVDRLPEEQRGEHELDVLKHLGVNLQVTRGFAAHEVESVHARAYALCRSSEDVARTFPVRWGIWVFHKVRSDLRRARAMCDELLAMARASGDTGFILQAHQAVCVTHLCLGAPDVTRDHMEQAAAVYDPAVHAGNTTNFGQDPGVATRAFGGVALWLLGRPDEALAASERSLELARRLDQPSSLAVAVHFAAMLHQCRGDADATAHWAAANIQLAAEEGFSFWHAGAQVLRGWATVARAFARQSQFDPEAGIVEIRRGLDAWLATGSRTYQTYYLGLLADALQRLSRHREALRALDEALAAAQLLPEGLYEAELYRLRGRSVLRTSQDPLPQDALECFEKALRIARAQGARGFEWRAAADLAPVLRRRKRKREAEDLLASIPPGFVSGGDPFAAADD